MPVSLAASSSHRSTSLKLIVQLAMHGQTHVNEIYDPAAGSGSLLLQAKNSLMTISSKKVFGQEINHTTYNPARMNMFLHNINYDKFDISWVIH